MDRVRWVERDTARQILLSEHLPGGAQADSELVDRITVSTISDPLVAIPTLNAARNQPFTSPELRSSWDRMTALPADKMAHALRIIDALLAADARSRSERSMCHLTSSIFS